jgi:DNA uptake protein ComE-like DNA-binding protein
MRKEGPYKNYQDLSRLPYMEPKRLQRLIQRIQPLSEF